MNTTVLRGNWPAIPDDLVSILRRISGKRYFIAAAGISPTLNEFNSHRLYLPFPVLIMTTADCPIPGSPFGGDCFPVECFTLSGDGITYIAHILDYRVTSSNVPMRRSLAQRFYKVMSTVPERYKSAATDLSGEEVQNCDVLLD